MLRRTVLSLVCLLLLAVRPGATWSIVCVDTRTREVGVASATCLTNFDLQTGVPVICVGEGAAAAQSFLDPNARNRRRIFASFRDTEMTPAAILADLAARDDGHQTRQYGIVNFAGAPVTFTGTVAGLAATGVTGSVGDFLYAIQGNVLTGNEVVFAAEQAFRAENGDMGQRLMAAMEAARALGGDGRCSCSQSDPTGCGVPPPGFTKSAHCGVVLVARVGDTDGCDTDGCAKGDYYLELNVRGNAASPEPVFVLQERYKTWRKRLHGRPDGLHSTAGPMKALPIDGVTEREITVVLSDLNKQRILHGGARIEVTGVNGFPTIAQPGPFKDHGDGRYTFTLRAGEEEWVDRFLVRIIDVSPYDRTDVVTATISPLLEIANVAVALYTSDEGLPVVRGGNVSFVVNRRDAPHAPYQLVARFVPGGRFRPGPLGAGLVLPFARRPFFPAGPLALDERGRAEVVLEVPPGVLAPLLGGRVEVTGYVLGGASEPTNTVVLRVVP